ncbi:hypothetical protein GCM10011365_06050 [Marinicella pacifica]|jgi:hypothetical protein|uniref:DUF4381 domain-containing protein n=1 Tax=Marinicella pacifica TaxID=1171543 RepID=A0A917CH79_9GAMM|nr:DUF4381 domain-containing protein [Marinicella pacifica]GGF87721.1 hypothetical protein GCM10011365_06050 [Marinicella pacifica]
MNPENAQKLPLRDVHLPAEPGFWPPAPGWWILAVMVLILLIGFGFWWRRHRYRHNKWQRMRLLLLTIRQNHQSHGDDVRFARDLSNLLRRFTRYELQDPVAAGLSGQSWIQFLNRDLSEPVFEAFKETLTRDLYRPQAQIETKALFEAVHQFLQQHCLKPSRSAHD